MAQEEEWLMRSEVADYVRENPHPDLIKFYNPLVNKCPHCGESRNGNNANMKIQWSRVNGKSVPKLPKKICTDECLDKELKHFIQGHDPIIESIAKQYALSQKFPHGTMFNFGGNIRNYHDTLFIWDDKLQKVVRLDMNLEFGREKENGEYREYRSGGIPINFLVGNGDFNPNTWRTYFKNGTPCYPNMDLIKQMRDAAKPNKGYSYFDVNINGKSYHVSYEPDLLKGKWESCYIVYNKTYTEGEYIIAKSGDPSWRGNRNKTVKNANSGLNRLAALPRLKANHSPNSNAFKALSAEEHNLIMKHLGGKTRKNRKRRY
jgi:hypothetical protein